MNKFKFGWWIKIDDPMSWSRSFFGLFAYWGCHFFSKSNCVPWRRSFGICDIILWRLHFFLVLINKFLCLKGIVLQKLMFWWEEEQLRIIFLGINIYQLVVEMIFVGLQNWHVSLYGNLVWMRSFLWWV